MLRVAGGFGDRGGELRHMRSRDWATARKEITVLQRGDRSWNSTGPVGAWNCGVRLLLVGGEKLRVMAGRELQALVVVCNKEDPLPPGFVCCFFSLYDPRK